MQNNNIIEFINNEARVSHRVIADKTNNKILSVQKLITDNIEILEEFGQVRFKIETVRNSVGAVNKEKTYYLNERQTTLALTFMRNNSTVKEFKIRLVRDFYKMREILQNSKPKIEETEIDKNLKGLNFVFQNLKVNEASKILMTETLYKKIGLET